MPVDDVLERIDRNEDASIDRLKEWLRIPSVGTDPAYDEQTQRAAAWCAERLREAGFEAELVPTARPEEGRRGQPIVTAHCAGADDYSGPHVLFYGHYDVQPPDPLDQWDTAPFDPHIKPSEGEMGERIVARGAVDDKGQVATFLEAMRAWKEQTGEPGGGVRYTVVIEGEEESGSTNLERFIQQHADRLKQCDVCLVSDTGMLGRGQPAITYGVRGMTYTEVALHGANQDMHSGQWGGRVPNPINELCRVLAQLHDSEGRVAIPGFYHDVRELTDEERRAWAELEIDDKAMLASVGLPPEADSGEQGYTPTERNWARPCADINGIIGGYTGAGAKTVIPASARAKVSFRLVPEQDPAQIRDMFFGWLHERTPPGFRWELIDHSGGAAAEVPTDSPYLAAARRALERASGEEAALIKTGGSIPIAGLLKRMLGLDTIFMGFGLDDDRVHAPNEKFELACFRLGMRAHALYADELRRHG